MRIEVPEDLSELVKGRGGVLTVGVFWEVFG